MIFGGRIELGGINKTRFGDLHQANDSRGFAVRVIKKSLITDSHRAHEIAGLVIANSIPKGGVLLLEMVNPVHIGLTFHQPVGHVS